MLNRLLEKLKEQPRNEPGVDQRLARAVLLLEVARADYEHHPLELTAVRKALAEEFRLSGEELDRLVHGAKEESHEAISLHEYVHALNKSLPPEEKSALMQSLWRVAYADGKLDPEEEYTLRKLADLLHVPHHEYIRTKLRATDA